MINGRPPCSQLPYGTHTSITLDGWTAQDCVLDGELFYAPGQLGVQNCGLVARFGGPFAANLFATPTDQPGPGFDTCYQSGGVTFEGVGMAATTAMDNFEFHDATLSPRPGSTARIGASHALDLVVGPGDPWVTALSAGHSGIPLGAEPRAIPLSADALFFATAGNPNLGVAGIADADGLATPTIPIPPIPSLAGNTLWVSAFTIDGARTFGVGKISNEQAFTIDQ